MLDKMSDTTRASIILADIRHDIFTIITNSNQFRILITLVNSPTKHIKPLSFSVVFDAHTSK